MEFGRLDGDGGKALCKALWPAFGVSFRAEGGHLAVVPRQPKAAPNLLFIAYDLLKGRPDNRDQRASQSTATIKLEYKT